MFRERLKLFLLVFLIESASFFIVALWFHPSVRPALPLWISVAVLGSILVALMIHTRYLRPLDRLAVKVAHVTQGPVTFAEGNLRRDELGVLARRLNDMAEEFRKEVENAIGEKEEVRAVITSMSEGVLVIGADKRILHASHPVIRMLDLRAGNPYGRFYWEVLRQEEVVAVIESALQSRVTISRELVSLTEGASFSMHAAPVFAAAERLHSVVVIFHDISAIKKFDRMRAEFVANVSHELKTPLTSIKGFAETLKSGGIDDPAVAVRFLGIIETQALRLEKLVSDILFLSAIEAQESAGELPAREPVSLATIIDDVLEAQRGQIQARGHALTRLIPNNTPQVQGDRIQLEQVFSNLISNAIKFTPPNGTITIEAVEEKGQVRIDIKDTGIGIPPEHTGRLFERFYRVDKARSQEMGGTGLGLAIVKHIVALHGGSVSVKSTPSVGTVFSVFLPRL
ncbi:MAG: PAS domain-containing protein [Candidatus Omnitrophica bacterium]|nr:PAS domain-containing protein [Candidatus Omnitrophota bacterium]